MSQPSPLHAPIIITPEDAPAYLAKMDIDPAHIGSAIESGEIAAGNITRHHPITAAGLIRWIYVVGTLREKLAETGRWYGRDSQNRPTSKRRDSGYTLSTVCGDEATGVIDHHIGPRASRRKGRATAAAVNERESLITIETLRGEPSQPDDLDGPPSGNWFLVYHRADGEVRREVSLPLGFDPDEGQFTGWRVRVILDKWTPDGVSERSPLDVGGQDVDFQVFEAS